MPEVHAKLPASASPRWIPCPPSAQLNLEAGEAPSEYAQQGTDAHTLCEHHLKQALGVRVRDPTKDLTWYDGEMEMCAQDYAAFVMEQIAEVKKYCKDPTVLVEQQLDLSDWIPQGFGTADVLIAGDDLLVICDYKHGKGVKVEATSPQLKCYGLGCIAMFDGVYDIQRVRMAIFQPRLGNISINEMTKEELLRWGDEVLKPAAQLAFRGDGALKAGEHCKFCRVKDCRERARYNLELAQYDFQDPVHLDDAEIAEILSRIDELTAWATDIKEYALKQALSGKHFDHWKLVEGRSIRRYTDEKAVAAAVEAAGYDPYEKKIKGITTLTSELGRKQFNELLGRLVEKPAGKPTLVPESDKRPELDIETAKEEFKEDESL